MVESVYFLKPAWCGAHLLASGPNLVQRTNDSPCGRVGINTISAKGQVRDVEYCSCVMLHFNVNGFVRNDSEAERNNVPFGIVLVIALVHSLRCGPGIAAIICQIYDF